MPEIDADRMLAIARAYGTLANNRPAESADGTVWGPWYRACIEAHQRLVEAAKEVARETHE